MVQILSIPIRAVKSKPHTAVGRFAKDLKEMVGMTFEGGVPSYVKNIPVKSAKFDLRPYFDGDTETILKITFENGKTIEKDVQQFFSEPGVF